jgi:hypothetical protein
LRMTSSSAVIVISVWLLTSSAASDGALLPTHASKKRASNGPRPNGCTGRTPPPMLGLYPSSLCAARALSTRVRRHPKTLVLGAAVSSKYSHLQASIPCIKVDGLRIDQRAVHVKHDSDGRHAANTANPTSRRRGAQPDMRVIFRCIFLLAVPRNSKSPVLSFSHDSARSKRVYSQQ